MREYDMLSRHVNTWQKLLPGRPASPGLLRLMCVRPRLANLFLCHNQMATDAKLSCELFIVAGGVGGRRGQAYRKG